MCVCVCVCMFIHLKIEAMPFIQGSYSFSMLAEWWLSGELIWDPLLWVYVICACERSFVISVYVCVCKPRELH